MNYLLKLINEIKNLEIKKLDKLIKILKSKYKKKKKFFICGNGGSAANANHISNDFMLGFNKSKIGFPIISLSSNLSKISCIANDVGYEKIFSHQLKILGHKDDLLIILSGSGNSKNIIEAVKIAKKMKIYTFGLIGYDGGKVKKILDNYIHFKTKDMQICEDMQMIAMNYVMKKIYNQKFKF
jgi:D-sedoheptulose 7-phosphate isomerase